jgi:hypothetical protein
VYEVGLSFLEVGKSDDEEVGLIFELDSEFVGKIFIKSDSPVEGTFFVFGVGLFLGWCLGAIGLNVEMFLFLCPVLLTR